MDLMLSDKRALVTGASEGIGRAVVEMLAAEGCDVAFCSRRQEALDELAVEVAEKSGRRLLPIASDVSDREQVEDFVARAAAGLGGVDILVNNAGASIFGPLEEVPDERWAADIELKLLSYVRGTRAALPHLRAAGGGRVVHIGGNAGRQPLTYHLPGGACNAAILNLTVALAQDVAKDNIHVLNCAPGPVKTARFVKQVAANARKWGVSEAEAEERFTSELPLGYVPTAEEVAGVIVFLASPRAAYMTGTTVTVDGGITRGI
jgi:NAD(P)-dependent dehydrogenase (short-subunit alcohol dehydrogenase family)